SLPLSPRCILDLSFFRPNALLAAFQETHLCQLCYLDAETLRRTVEWKFPFHILCRSNGRVAYRFDLPPRKPDRRNPRDNEAENDRTLPKSWRMELERYT